MPGAAVYLSPNHPSPPPPSGPPPAGMPPLVPSPPEVFAALEPQQCGLPLQLFTKVRGRGLLLALLGVCVEFGQRLGRVWAEVIGRVRE